jgi:hypothetical protein
MDKGARGIYYTHFSKSNVVPLVFGDYVIAGK